MIAKKSKITLFLFVSLMFTCLLFVQKPLPCYGQDIIPVTIITIDIGPATLNLQSNGKFVTVHTDLPYDQVNSATVMLNGVAILSSKVDDLGNFVAKFSRDEVEALEGFIIGDYNKFQLVGETVDGFPFSGEQDIMVIDVEGLCLKTNLMIASRLCNSYMSCELKGMQNRNGNFDEQACLGSTDARLARRWNRTGRNAQANCAAGSMDVVSDQLRYGLDDIYAQIEAGINTDDPNGARFLRKMMKATARYCNQLLRAEAVCAVSGNEAKKTILQNRAENKIQNTWERQMKFRENKHLAYDGPSVDEIMGMVEDLKNDVVAEIMI